MKKHVLEIKIRQIKMSKYNMLLIIITENAYNET